MCDENEACGLPHSASGPGGEELTRIQAESLQQIFDRLTIEHLGSVIAAAGLIYLTKAGSASALIQANPISIMPTINPATRVTLEGLKRLMNGE